MNTLEQAIKDLEARRGEVFTQTTLHLLAFKEALPLVAKLTSTNPVHMSIFMGLLQTFSGLTALVAGAKGFKVEDLVSEGDKLTEIIKKLSEGELLSQVKLLLAELDKPIEGFTQ